MASDPVVGQRVSITYSREVEGVWEDCRDFGRVTGVYENGRGCHIEIDGGETVLAHPTSSRGWLVSGGKRMKRVHFLADGEAA